MLRKPLVLFVANEPICKIQGKTLASVLGTKCTTQYENYCQRIPFPDGTKASIAPHNKLNLPACQPQSLKMPAEGFLAP